MAALWQQQKNTGTRDAIQDNAIHHDDVPSALARIGVDFFLDTTSSKVFDVVLIMVNGWI